MVPLREPRDSRCCAKMRPSRPDCNPDYCSRRQTELSIGSFCSRNRPAQAVHRDRELFGATRKTEAHETLAAGAERGARRKPDVGLVDQLQGEPTRVRLTIDA